MAYLATPQLSGFQCTKIAGASEGTTRGENFTCFTRMRHTFTLLFGSFMVFTKHNYLKNPFQTFKWMCCQRGLETGFGDPQRFGGRPCLEIWLVLVATC